MITTSRLASLAAAFATVRHASAVFNPSSKNNVAVYWGQNSHGRGGDDPEAQQRLAYYCANSDIDVIPMAFMTKIGGADALPELNFANQGDPCGMFDGTNLKNCPQIAEDIATCQEQYGKTILLSIGGATYTEGGFQSESAAVTAANKVWDIFGPYNSGSSALRPFNNSAVDGFDFDFESPVQNMIPFVRQLRTLVDSGSDGKKRYLTAAPQCPYPDAADQQFLDAVGMDAVFVQFYNNYCGVQSYNPGASQQNNFNFDTWDKWATQTSPNKNVKVLLGIPASSTAAGSGYLEPTALAPVIPYVKNFSSMGGVMMWDASQALSNKDFLAQVAGELDTSSAQSTSAATSAVASSTGTSSSVSQRSSGVSSSSSSSAASRSSAASTLVTSVRSSSLSSSSSVAAPSYDAPPVTSQPQQILSRATDAPSEAARSGYGISSGSSSSVVPASSIQAVLPPFHHGPPPPMRSSSSTRGNPHRFVCEEIVDDDAAEAA
ncbi:glycoside hydrolase superfamily [Phyllosticta citrichinensis]|uniref:chitinase n=1 Tax=Phyllosticta citrichinensis TaxID=1130410 RepID=A0ABR1XX53_9PEZI